MKSILNNKPLCIGIMVVIMACSTLGMGVHQIKKLQEKVNDEFRYGQYNDGLSIRKDIVDRSGCAFNIYTIATSYMDHSDKELMGLLEDISTLNNYSDLHTLFEANQRIQGRVDKVYGELMDMDISSEHARTLKEQKSIFDNCQKTIGYDPYNSYVAEYEKKTDTLIGKLFKVFVKDVEYFE